MAIVYVNGVSASDDLPGGGSLSLVISPVFPGALLVVMASLDSPNNYSSIDYITDTSGNSYSRITTQNSLNSYQRLDMWYACGAASALSNTITVNFTDATGPPGVTTYTKRVIVLQYYDPAPVAPLLGYDGEYGTYSPLTYPVPSGPWSCYIYPLPPPPPIPAGSLIVAGFTFGNFPGATSFPNFATGGGVDRVIDKTRNFTGNFVVPGWNVIRPADGKLATITSTELTGITAGIATVGTTTTKLIDSTKDFVALGVLPGNYIIFPTLPYNQINTITTTTNPNDTLNLWWATPGLAVGTSYKISPYYPIAGVYNPTDTLIYTPSGSTPVFAPGDEYWVPAVTPTTLTAPAGWTLRVTTDILGVEDIIWSGGPIGFTDIGITSANWPQYEGIWAAFVSGGLPPLGPTMDQIMRHGKWFGSGHFQGCWLGWR